MRRSLGLPDGVAHLTPNELISAILIAPVDLIFNGGVGTFVKASSETHSAAGDKANDRFEVNGGQLRARCVAEGGNLGFTQLGRIEYAQTGGRINTDFIDNSAGVDTSDHEVNIKILLSDQVASGRLGREERDALLASMTDEVAQLVLAHNLDQNLALSNSELRSSRLMGLGAHLARREAAERRGERRPECARAGQGDSHGKETPKTRMEHLRCGVIGAKRRKSGKLALIYDV